MRTMVGALVWGARGTPPPMPPPTMGNPVMECQNVKVVRSKFKSDKSNRNKYKNNVVLKEIETYVYTLEIRHDVY